MMPALLAALAGALGYGVGSVLQAVGARRARGPAALVQPVYLAGLGCDLAAWLLSLLALQRLPLFTVQALLAGSLAVTVLLAWAFLGARPRPRDLVAVGVVVLALVVVAAASGDEAVGPTPAWFVPALLIGLGVVAVVVLVLYPGRRPGGLALAAGLGFSGAAVAARGLGTPDGAHGGLAALALDPVAWCVLGFGALGILAYSRALERGQVGAVTAVLWVVEVIVPGIVGVLVLGDGVRPGAAPVFGLAVAAAVAGCAVLATSPAQPEA